jgi:hypothetical protein
MMRPHRGGKVLGRKEKMLSEELPQVSATAGLPAITLQGKTSWNSEGMNTIQSLEV